MMEKEREREKKKEEGGESFPFIALLSLSLLAVWPIVRAGYPSIGDGLNHLYRLVEFDHLLRNGVWFPRWATDLGYGYGYPLFNFYPPLVYYLGALFHLFGLSFASSLLAIYILAIVLAITGAYALARERWSETGGLIAAVAYGLSPYLYFNIFARGALPETWALGLLPWVLWAFSRLARQPSNRNFLLATFLYSALILSHLLSAVLATPLLFLFSFIAFISSLNAASHQPAVQPPSSVLRPSSFILGPSSFLLSLLLTSFFLLPALLETRHVQIHQLVTPGDLDFHNNFLSLSQLFAWPQTFDSRLVFIPVPPSLSLAALALALLGLIPQLWNSASNYQPQRLRTSDSAKRPRGVGPRTFPLALGIWELGLGSCFLFLCLFTLPLTVFIWEKLPFANFIQFPWRLVGPASLILALLAAASVQIIEDSRSKAQGLRLKVQGASSFVLRPPSSVIRHSSFIILFLSSLTWTFAPPYKTPLAPTVRDLAAYEASGQLGTTSAGEFLPRDVHQLPDPNSLRADYAAAPIINRLAPLPTGTTLLSQSATLTSATATVQTQSATPITFNFFYFPGWQATIDGQTTSIQISNPNGLIAVPIESGRHTISVRFSSTPLRATAQIISFLTLIALAFHSSRVTLHVSRLIRLSSILRPPSFVLRPSSFILLPLTILLTRLLFIDGHDTLFSRSRFNGATVSGVQETLDINFENQLVLIGLDQPSTTIAADETLPVTLYWRAQNLPKADYATTLQVVDENGNLFGQADSRHPGLTPTSRWSLDQYARDVHRLTFLPGTPPGEYHLLAGVYRFGGSALNVLDENQIPQGQAFDLGTLSLTRAKKPPTELQAKQSLNLQLGPLTLLGETLETPSPLVGDEVRLTLFWRADTAARPDLKLRLELTALNGDVIHSLETDVARSDYPTSNWSLNEIVRAPIRFRIPASAPAGSATLSVSLISSDGALISSASQIATFDLRVPERSFTIPNISHSRNDMFGSAIKLLGYDLDADHLRLYWQALAPMDTSYTAFVHTLSADDQLLNQIDSIPLNGSRPTTGWLPGEVLTDPYTLSLSGAAKIEIGLYNARSLERLGTVVINP
jgi:hypothetical protein